MQNSKLNKKDIILISVLSIILSAMVFLSLGAFFDGKFVDLGNDKRGYGNVGTTEQIGSTILRLPYSISFLILYPVFPNDRGIGAAIYTAILSPISGLVFWFLLFYLFARIGNRLLKTGHFLLKHSLSILITLFIIGVFTHFYFTHII